MKFYDKNRELHDTRSEAIKANIKNTFTTVKNKFRKKDKDIIAEEDVVEEEEPVETLLKNAEPAKTDALNIESVADDDVSVDFKVVDSTELEEKPEADILLVNTVSPVEEPTKEEVTEEPVVEPTTTVEKKEKAAQKPKKGRSKKNETN